MALLALIAAPPAVYAGYIGVTGNLHTVEAGRLYRAGQMDSDDLDALIRRAHIRTVINLRGAHPDKAWYQAEMRVIRALSVDYVPIAISAREEPDGAEMAQIAKALTESPQPILVHCYGGADRTGLASAMFQLIVAGRPREKAFEQLSIAYGHIPTLFARTIAMDRAFEEFAAYWAKGAGRTVATLD